MKGWPQRRRRELARRLDADARHRATDAGMDKLVALAGRLRSVPLQTDASPDFRDALRERLLTQAGADTAPRTSETRPSKWRLVLTGLRAERGLALTTAVLTLVVAISGLWAGTNRALPGEPLYGLKLRAESVQLQLTPSRQERGKDHLAFADRRLAEVSGLLQRYRGRGGHGAVGEPNAAGPDRRVTKLIDKTLLAMDAQTSAGADALRVAYKNAGRTTSLQYLDHFARLQRKELVGVVPELPTAAQPRARRSLQLVNRVGEEASALLDRAPNGQERRHESNQEAAPTERATPTPSASAAHATNGHTPNVAPPTPGSTDASSTTAGGDDASPRNKPSGAASTGACELGLCGSDPPQLRSPHTPSAGPSSPRATKPSKPAVHVSAGPDGVGIDVNTCRLLKAC